MDVGARVCGLCGVLGWAVPCGARAWGELVGLPPPGWGVPCGARVGGESTGLPPPVLSGAVGSLGVGGGGVDVGARVCGLCGVLGWAVPCGARAGVEFAGLPSLGWGVPCRARVGGDSTGLPPPVVR